MEKRENCTASGDELKKGMTKREVFSMCGKLVGHYPMAGWLRVACSYVKRQTVGDRWGDYAGDKVCKMLNKMFEQVREEDPVKGKKKAPQKTKGVIWVGAGDLALGVLVEIEGVPVQNAAWLRKQNDYSHINDTGLEAAPKGVKI